MNQQTTPLVNDSAGQKALYILAPILAIGILLYLLRIFTRIIPTRKMKSSDYMSTFAVLAATITYILLAKSVSHGLGRHSVHITPENKVRILQYLYGDLMVGLLTSVFSRISVACLLLELPLSKTWKAVLWVTIAIQLATLISTLPLQVFHCSPIRAYWEPVAGGKCISPAVMWTIGYVFGYTSIFGDLLQAILPIFMIWRLNRSIVERCLVCFLMATGLFASGAGVMKIISMKNFNRTSPNSFLEVMPVFLWYRIEEALLVVASSAPLLKCSVGKALQRLGLHVFRFKTLELNWFHSFRMSAVRRRQNFRSWQEPAGNQETKDDQSKLEAGEHSSSTASSPSDVYLG